MSASHLTRRWSRGSAWVTAGVLSLATLAVAGCVGGHDDGSQADRVVVKGVPDGWEGPAPDVMDASPVVGWVGDGPEFGVVTFGSSSCPVVAGKLQVVAPDAVEIAFTQSPRDPCTADMSATTHVFQLPSSVDRRPVTVTVDVEGFEEYLLELP